MLSPYIGTRITKAEYLQMTHMATNSRMTRTNHTEEYVVGVESKCDCCLSFVTIFSGLEEYYDGHPLRFENYVVSQYNEPGEGMPSPFLWNEV
jgi:hypothetical protein